METKKKDTLEEIDTAAANIEHNLSPGQINVNLTLRPYTEDLFISVPVIQCILHLTFNKKITKHDKRKKRNITV